MRFWSRVPAERERPPRFGDAQALERYRQLLRTAPPDVIEQAHAEAFPQLTPAQRAQLLRELTEAGISETGPRALLIMHRMLSERNGEPP